MAPRPRTIAQRTTLQRTGAALLSAVCMVLCCPNYDLWWLGLVAWVPYLWAIEGLRPRQAMRYGWLTGTVTVFWGFFWLSNLLTKFAGLPMLAALPVTLVFAMWHGLIWGLAAYLIAWLRGRGASLLVVAPMCWVVTEALLPNLFPIYMALGWCWQPLLIQTAELGGVTTVSATMVALNTALYRVLVSRFEEGRLDRRALVMFIAFAIGIPSYGAIRIAQVEADMEAAPKLKIAAVQGNFSIFQMRQRNQKIPILRRQQALTAQYEAQGAQLAVWGETAYPNPNKFFRDSETDLSERDPWKVQRGFSIPVVFGTVTRHLDRKTGRPRRSGPDKYPYNTALLIDGEGKVADMYDKVYRLAFGEYAPLVDPDWYLSVVPNASHIAQGKGPDVMEVSTPQGTWRLGPFICYEDILPRFVREAANQGVHVFINLTNDAWFGKTREPAQHLGLAVFRTVEHRKGLVRAVNTGISTIIDPTGRLVAKTRVTDPDIDGPQPAEGVLADVPMMDPEARTLYGMTGDLFVGLMVFGIVVVAWRTRGQDEVEAASEDQANASDEDLDGKPLSAAFTPASSRPDEPRGSARVPPR